MVVGTLREKERSQARAGRRGGGAEREGEGRPRAGEGAKVCVLGVRTGRAGQKREGGGGLPVGWRGGR